MHMCMYVTLKYSHLHPDTQSDTCRYAVRYIQKCSQIQSDTYRFALLPKIHMCLYSTAKYSHIHTDMHCPQECMYLHVCRLNIPDIQAHMHWIQLQDTAEDTYRYSAIHAGTSLCISHIISAMCICDMHSVVSCAYKSAYVYVFLAHTSHIYQSISVIHVLKIHTHMHWQVH